MSTINQAAIKCHMEAKLSLLFDIKYTQAIWWTLMSNFSLPFHLTWSRSWIIAHILNDKGTSGNTYNQQDSDLNLHHQKTYCSIERGKHYPHDPGTVFLLSLQKRSISSCLQNATSEYAQRFCFFDFVDIHRLVLIIFTRRSDTTSVI